MRACIPTVIVLSGEQIENPFDPPVPPGESGLFDWSDTLSGDSFNTHNFNEDDVTSDGSGPVLDMLMEGINSGEIFKIVMIGHSHGGGSVADLAAALAADSELAPYRLIMTAYIDAISNDSTLDIEAEPGPPASTEYHINIWTQLYSNVAGMCFRGIPMAADFDIDINTLDCVENVNHENIDDCSVVHAILSNHLENVTNICGEATDIEPPCSFGVDCENDAVELQQCFEEGWN